MRINTIKHQLICQRLQHHHLTPPVNVDLRHRYVGNSRFKPSDSPASKQGRQVVSSASVHIFYYRPAFNIVLPVERSVDFFRLGDLLGSKREGRLI